MAGISLYLVPAYSPAYPQDDHTRGVKPGDFAADQRILGPGLDAETIAAWPYRIVLTAN